MAPCGGGQNMRAVIILYEGAEVPIVTQKEIISNMAYLMQPNTSPSLSQLNDKEVARLLISDVLKEQQATVIDVKKASTKILSKEDNAAIYLSELFKDFTTPTTSTTTLAGGVADFCSRKISIELQNAIKILSQPDAIKCVKYDILKKHHISREQLGVIVKVASFMLAL